MSSAKPFAGVELLFFGLQEALSWGEATRSAVGRRVERWAGSSLVVVTSFLSLLGTNAKQHARTINVRARNFQAGYNRYVEKQ
jgi:hypothetical protein